METFTLDSSDGTRLAAYRWDAAGAPRGVVQLTHGMGEHAQRYGYVAEALGREGFVTYAQDHRGHGASAASVEAQGDLGADGWNRLVGDLAVLRDHVAAEHDDLPVVLFGHSMGSFAAQQYLPDHSDLYSGVILTGTAAIDLLESSLDLDGPIDLSGFNAPFEPRTGFEWLSRDEAQVDAYVADVRCGFGLDAASGKEMFVQARRLADPAVLGGIRRDLPVYVAVGEHDPVNAGLAAVTPLVERYEAAGLTDVTLVTYPGARHEILNETNRDEVIAGIVAWLDRVAGR